MKILLIEPPFYRLYSKDFSLDKYPLSIGYLTSIIKSNTNHDVVGYNSDFSPNSKPMSHEFLAGEGFKNYINNLNDLNYCVWEEIIQYVTHIEPTVVGITAKSQNYRSACNTARIIKKTNPNITVIIGGPHPTLIGAETLEEIAFDIAVFGEGEHTFLELINKLKNNDSLDEVRGISFRQSGKIITTGQRSLASNLDNIPNPYLYVKETLKDFNLYPLKAFRSIFATRGCPFSCTFCGAYTIWSRKVRFRSTENIVNEINYLRTLGVNYFNFDDDTFGVTKKYLQSLCNALIEHCSGIKWSCEIHIKLVDEDVLSLMKKAGCDLIKIGIESGNNKILKEINKNITIEEAYAASKKIHKAGIHIMSFFMVGFPQETEESLNDTILAIRNIKGFATYSIFTPYIGTKAYETCKTLNLIPENFDVSIYNHQSPNNCFCAYISHEKFREIASRVEKEVDIKNDRYERNIKLRKLNPIYLLKRIFAN